MEVLLRTSEITTTKKPLTLSQSKDCRLRQASFDKLSSNSFFIVKNESLAKREKLTNSDFDPLLLGNAFRRLAALAPLSPNGVILIATLHLRHNQW